MSNENQNAYDVVLADMIARRDQLNAAIEAIEAARSGGFPGATAATSAPGPAQIKPDDFFGMTVLEATKKYLGMMKRPQSSQVITDALQSGGYLFSSENPVATVASVLNRDDSKGGDVVRIGKGTFGLAIWYPNRPKRKKNGSDAENADDQSGSENADDGQSEDKNADDLT